MTLSTKTYSTILISPLIPTADDDATLHGSFLPSGLLGLLSFLG